VKNAWHAGVDMSKLVVDLTKVANPLSLIRGASATEIILYHDRSPDPAVIRSALNAVISQKGRVIITLDPADISLEHTK
jgi:hypothetical protein